MSIRSNFWGKFACLIGLLALLWSSGDAAHALAASGPTIAGITDNAQTYANGQILQYSKYELTFQVETVATNPYFPYDPAPPPGIEPGVGVTVKALFTPDQWKTVYVQPGFYYQEFQSEIRDGKPWYYPTGEFAWKVRFAPHRPGQWAYKIVVQDPSGTTESPVGTFTVAPSDTPGFVKVSQRDPRYFEFDDGSLFLGQGYGMVLREDQPETFAKLQRNGIQLGRVWLAPYSIFGSAWNPFYESRNNYGGYIPRTGMIAFPDDVTGRESIKLRIDWRDGNSGWFDACRVLAYWGTPTEVKPNTRYRIQVRYRGFDITGPRLSTQSEYGFVVKTSLGPPKCYDPGGVVLTNYGKNTPGAWSVIEGTWDSGNRNFLPHFWFVLENATNGEVYIDTISIQEDLGNGQYGPNIVHKPSTQHHLYFQQHNSFVLDRRIEMAEQYGLYLKLVILEKGEDIFRKIAADGSFVDDQDNLFYGVGRQLTATRWLQQAWWRYLQARWGYSTSVHSWELINEGNPTLTDHYALTDELGKYMHCRVFDIPVNDGDGAKCTYDHPNDHMVTTSFWHSFPADAFWGNPKYPNVDYADVHAYVSTGWLQDPSHEVDVAAYHVDYGRSVRDNLDYAVGANPTKPIVRGEAGIDFVNQQKEQPDLARDTEGVWLHNFVWSGVDASGLMELYWWGHNRETQPGPDGEPGLHEIYGAFARFMADIPLNNGHYQDAHPQVSTPELRAWGQQDPVHEQAHLWIQNRRHTWRNVVDGVPISPVTGTVQLTNFRPNQPYNVEWWDTRSGSPSRTEQVTSNAAGELVLQIANLQSDVAVKIGPAGASGPSRLELAGPAEEVVVGQQFDIEVLVNGAEFDGAAAYLDFDPTKLQVMQVRFGPRFDAVLQDQHDNSAGTADLAAGTLINAINGMAPLATVRFQAISAGPSEIEFHRLAPRKSDISLHGASVLENVQETAITIVAKARLEGKIQLQGRPQPPNTQWMTPLTVALHRPGDAAPSYSFTVYSDDSGSFTLPAIDPGVYEIAIRNPHSLQRVLTADLPLGVHQLAVGELFEGDARVDNVVDMLDFSLLSAQFNTCNEQRTTKIQRKYPGGNPVTFSPVAVNEVPPEVTTDFNQDGCVDVQDFSLLAANFGVVGEEVGGVGAAEQTIQLGYVQDRKQGQRFQIPIRVVSPLPTRINAAAVYLRFDPDVLRIEEQSSGDALDVELLNQIDNQLGEAAYVAGKLGDDVSTPFMLTTLTVEALQDVDKTPLSLVIAPPRRSGVTADGQMQPFQAGYQGGEIRLEVLGAPIQLYLPTVGR